MNEERKDTIIYDEDFKTVEKVVVRHDEDDKISEEEIVQEKEQREKTVPKNMLVIIQLVICLVIAIAVFLLKTTDCEFYRNFVKWYNEEQQKTLISSQQIEKIDLNSIFFKATPDSATKDEI
ncbi:MAG: hypothetical protein KBS62_06805 [Oscillospiraceae bacterium]|nr:hypothetical protein [Candidatus Ruminococcus equi]